MGRHVHRLREWLTVPEAAAYLSSAFGEQVTEAEVLRLGLDGQLSLSVNFVNPTQGRTCRVVRVDDSDMVRPLQHVETAGKSHTMVGDVVLEEYYIVELEHQEEQQEIVIDGIWDLTMTASAKAEVEDRCQMLTGGPRVAGIESFGGVFVKQANGPWCQLRKSGSDRKGEPQHWSPAGALPDDAVLVVRTAALNYLIGRMFARQEQAPQSEQPTKSHSVDAVASAGLTPEAFEIAAQDLESKVGRRKAVDAFLASCTHTAQEPILQGSSAESVGDLTNQWVTW